MNNKVIPRGNKRDIINAEVVKEIEASEKLISEFNIEPFQIDGDNNIPMIMVPFGKKIKINAKGPRYYGLLNMDIENSFQRGKRQI